MGPGPQVRGKNAEIHAARKYGFSRSSSSWYDGIGATGTKYEVKSGIESVRLWADQHRSLTAAPSAYYVFVKVSRSGRVSESIRRDPTTVTQVVNEYGGWVKSGHHRSKSKEKYVPINALL